METTTGKTGSPIRGRLAAVAALLCALAPPLCAGNLLDAKRLMKEGRFEAARAAFLPLAQGPATRTPRS